MLYIHVYVDEQEKPYSYEFLFLTNRIKIFSFFFKSLKCLKSLRISKQFIYCHAIPVRAGNITPTYAFYHLTLTNWLPTCLLNYYL